MQAQAEFSVKVSHAAACSVTLARTIRYEHSSTDEGLLRIIIKHKTRDCQQCIVRLGESIRLKDYPVVILVADYHILVAHKFTEHLIQRLILDSKRCRLVDIP